jgi:hypothetical protein
MHPVCESQTHRMREGRTHLTREVHLRVWVFSDITLAAQSKSMHIQFYC